jgi:hypothetical protein
MRRACHGGSSRGTTGEAIAKPIGHRLDRAPSPGMFGRQVAGRLNLRQCRAMPRQLTDDERRLLDGLLANDFDGADALQIQATSVTARRVCKCGCGTIELVPAQPNAPRSTARSPVPAEGRVFDDEGKEIWLAAVPRGRSAALAGDLLLRPAIALAEDRECDLAPASAIVGAARIAALCG